MRASLCIYCGMAIQHPLDPEKIPEIYKILAEHDQQCEKNPLVIKIRQLKELVELAYKEGWADDCGDSVDEDWDGSKAKTVLERF